jgi:Protein of unknown function (DUF3224)
LSTVHRCFFIPGLFLNGTIAIEFFGSQLITKETLVTAHATGPFDVYVAGERAAGTPHGMTRGTPHLSIAVVADSGTGQVIGLTGTMKVIITVGKHSYDFSYSLPAAK